MHYWEEGASNACGVNFREAEQASRELRPNARRTEPLKGGNRVTLSAKPPDSKIAAESDYAYRYPTRSPSVRSGRMSLRVMI